MSLNRQKNYKENLSKYKEEVSVTTLEEETVLEVEQLNSKEEELFTT